jgi:hypothetical protein
MVYRDELMVFPFVKTLLFLACMLALAAVIYFLSLWSYKRRKSEIAEQAMGGGAFQTVVKIFVSFAGAALLYAIFADAGIVWQGIAVFFGALLIGSIAELVFSRGIRFFLKNIKWLAGTGAVCCILMVAAHLDFIGYTTRVPSLQSIESVSINYTGRFTDLVSNSWYYRNGDDAILTSPDSIDIVTQMHKLAVENQPGDRYYNPEHPYGNIRIKYKLKSGMTMERYYNQLYHEALTTLADLEDKDDYITLNSPAFYMDHADSPQTELIRRVTISSSLRDTNHDVRLGAQETQRLLEAVRADMLAESLSEIKAPTQPALGYLQFEYYSNEDYDPEYYYYYKDTALINTVIVTHEYAHTIAALRELGLYDKFAPTEEADSVYILQSDYYDMPRVRALGSQSYDDHFFQSVYSYMASDSTDDGSSVLAASEDAATVREIESAAANQLLMADPSRYNSSSDPDAYIETMTYNVVFCRDGKALGLKMIRFDQLPQNLRQQVVDYYQTDRDYSLGYTAEAVSDGIIL